MYDSVDWSPDDSKIATGGFVINSHQEPVIRIWDATNGQVLHVLRAEERGIWEVKWSPDSQYLASAGIDGTVRVWDGKTGEQLVQFDSPEPIFSVDWHPDGTHIVFYDQHLQTLRIETLSDIVIASEVGEP